MVDRTRKTLRTAAVRRLLGGEKGAVAMEYLMVTMVVILPLLGLSRLVFDASGGPDPGGRDVVFDVSGPMTDRRVSGRSFGVLGDAFVGWYQRILCGISLPVP